MSFKGAIRHSLSYSRDDSIWLLLFQTIARALASRNDDLQHRFELALIDCYPFPLQCCSPLLERMVGLEAKQVRQS